jgi:hypothetical protein
MTILQFFMSGLAKKARLVSGALALALLCCGSAGAQTQTCNESCLKGFMDAYLHALAAHDASTLPLAKSYRYTENGAQLDLGKEGLWVTFNSYGPYRHDVFDASTGGVATYVNLMENHEIPFPDLLMVRLKIVNRKITEIETVVDRHAVSAKNLPPKDPSWMEIMNREEPAATRLSREQLRNGALGYLRSVAFRDSHLAPYAESCIRLEDGNVTAIGPHDTPPVPIGPQPTEVPGQAPRPNMLGIGCGKQLDYGEYSFITGFALSDHRREAPDRFRHVRFHAPRRHRELELQGPPLRHARRNARAERDSEHGNVQICRWQDFARRGRFRRAAGIQARHRLARRH